MKVFLAFMFAVVLLSVWEFRGGPSWRSPAVLIGCAVVAVTFLSLRVV